MEYGRFVVRGRVLWVLLAVWGCAWCAAFDSASASASGLLWSARASVDPGGGGGSVSCASSSSCVIVDSKGDALSYDGSNWGAMVSIDPGHTLTAVSCAPATTFCVAVDSAGDAVLGSGSAWAAPAAVDPGQELVSVSCPSSSFCMAIDANGGSVTYDGSGWSSRAGVPSSVGGVSQLVSVSCVTSLFCVAVGNTDSSSSGAAFVWSGSIWSAPTEIDPPLLPDGPGNPLQPAFLDSVSCVSASFCIAADRIGNLITFDGSAWSSMSTGLPGPSSISCASTASCVVLSGQTLVSFNGTTWSYGQQVFAVPASTLTAPDSVTCATSAFCVGLDGAGNVTVGTEGATGAETLDLTVLSGVKNDTTIDDRVNATGSPFACAFQCAFTFPAGRQVTLTPVPAAGDRLLGWGGSACPADIDFCTGGVGGDGVTGQSGGSGACAKTLVCTIALNDDADLTAVFASQVAENIEIGQPNPNVRHLLRRGYRQQFDAPIPGSLAIVWRLERYRQRDVTIATGRARYRAAGPGSIRITATRAARRLLRKQLQRQGNPLYVDTTGTFTALDRRSATYTGFTDLDSP
jgi:hypothetical protein